MLKGTQFVSLILLSFCLACSGGEGGEPIGGCGSYTDYAGTCTGTADNTFTFEGTVNGEAVVNTGNILYEDGSLAEGESISCAMSWASGGACTPCLFDIGECGEEAWDDYSGI